MHTNRLKERIGQGTPVFGPFMKFTDPAAVEIGASPVLTSSFWTWSMGRPQSNQRKTWCRAQLRDYPCDSRHGKPPCVDSAGPGYRRRGRTGAPDRNPGRRAAGGPGGQVLSARRWIQAGVLYVSYSVDVGIYLNASPTLSDNCPPPALTTIIVHRASFPSCCDAHNYITAAGTPFLLQQRFPDQRFGNSSLNHTPHCFHSYGFAAFVVGEYATLESTQPKILLPARLHPSKPHEPWRTISHDHASFATASRDHTS